MMHSRLLSLLSLVMAIATATTVIAAPLPNVPTAEPAVAELEANFLTHMIVHHRGAIEMAQLAKNKATHPELLALAQRIIKDQQREIDLMSGYLRDWYGKEPPAGTMMTPEMMPGMDMPMAHGMMPDMDAHMQALQATSGQDFDIAFMKAMIDHHAMAVMMAPPIIVNARHPELTALAEGIVIAQGNEIQQMDQWLKSWYGVTRVR